MVVYRPHRNFEETDSNDKTTKYYHFEESERSIFVALLARVQKCAIRRKKMTSSAVGGTYHCCGLSLLCTRQVSLLRVYDHATFYHRGVIPCGLVVECGANSRGCGI